ncbi:hypothetical protein SISNIDRAFT_482573 [Sistotremastrum niveocremeum HHB9708]|uniref:Transmembrane protein 188 n=2 Tax=Sistotremastraceae TaxID=3402574 RepID=A0A164YC62_9AGAM|nr:hypothetical protein SISNIDRAFT_482573 [Sistotremastrum niveocremeum HHB9708]KZT40201.1 hypothetical protein SISSUDRAFT_1060556 [Sistotremastrum suecicum HHB10207 ss-3]
MPPPQRTAFYPPNDSATYKDLLLFEERLKTNAAVLKSRKSRYQAFLYSVIASICVLASDVWLDTDLVTLLPNLALHKAWRDDIRITLHRYIAWGMLMVALTTLVLFFASGTYAEKVQYANRYVPHANKALRSFNMHLNMRPQPLQSKLNPFHYLFPRPAAAPSSQPQQSSPQRSPPTSPGSSKRTSPLPTPISPMPPATNPRGELIFSSRVDKNFRESYERYRASFERKREDRERAARGVVVWRYTKWIPGIRMIPWIREKEKEQEALATAALSAIRQTPTPNSSRRSSPAPHSKRRRGGPTAGSRSGTPILLRDIAPDRERSENQTYSLGSSLTEESIVGAESGFGSSSVSSV